MNLKIADVVEKAIGYMEKVGYSYSRIDKVEKNETDGVWKVTVVVGVGDKSKTIKIDDKSGDVIAYE